MSNGSFDLSRHHEWATTQLLQFCSQVAPALLDATTPGTYGSIIEILQHIIDAEASYTRRLTGAWPAHPWPDDTKVGIAVLQERAAILSATQQKFLAADWDDERIGEAYGDEGEVFAVRAGVYLAQLYHHANEHRAHVCSIIGAQGIEPPDVSAWGYADATGRSWLKSELNDEG